MSMQAAYDADRGMIPVLAEVETVRQVLHSVHWAVGGQVAVHLVIDPPDVPGEY